MECQRFLFSLPLYSNVICLICMKRTGCMRLQKNIRPSFLSPLTLSHFRLFLRCDVYLPFHPKNTLWHTVPYCTPQRLRLPTVCRLLASTLQSRRAQARCAHRCAGAVNAPLFPRFHFRLPRGRCGCLQNITPPHITPPHGRCRKCAAFGALQTPFKNLRLFFFTLITAYLALGHYLSIDLSPLLRGSAHRRAASSARHALSLSLPSPSP